MMKHLVLVLAALAACTAVDSPASEWPGVRRGVWRLTIDRPGVARVESEERVCTNTAFMFQRSPNTGRTARSGCRFASRRTGPAAFEVTTTCTLQGGGRRISTGAVSVASDREFDAAWRTPLEGRDAIDERITGRWVRPCEP